MTDTKRKNFTKDEKETIISLTLKYKNIIENKKSDSDSLEEKEKCWKSISDEFNSSTSTPRTTAQLKTFYKNTKSEIKKKIAANRAFIFRISGGENQSLLEKNDPLISVVTAQTNSVENDYDSSRKLFEIERVEDTIDESSSNTVLENDSQPSQANSSGRRKRQRSRQSTPLKEERHKLFKEIIELKRQKIASDIEKNNLKAEVYKAKLDILKKYNKKNNREED